MRSTVDGYQSAVEIIRQRIGSVMVMPFVFDNGDLTTPPTGNYALISILFPESRLEELGRKRWRTYGQMIVQFNVSAGSGDADILNQCDRIKPLFRSTTANGITYQTPSLDRLGIAPNNLSWYKSVFLCPFYFDEFEQQ